MPGRRGKQAKRDPDFKSSSRGPTSLTICNRHGECGAVRRARPRNARKAVTLPEVEDPHREPGADGWAETAPFRCLGMYKGRYCYLPFGHGQIVELTAASHAREMELARLASDDWWAQEFSTDMEHGVHWKKAGKAVMQHCHDVGIFRPERVRGRGFWPDEDGQIIGHFGDRC